MYKRFSSLITRKIKLRPNAVTRLLELSRDKGTVLSVKVESGGCSGFQYILDLVPRISVKPGTNVLEQDGTTIIVDDMSLELLSGCEIDFVEDMVRASFAVIKNDFAESKCGCGSSFNIGFL